jgi:hypothetical protein
MPWSGTMTAGAAAANPRADVLIHYLGRQAKPHIDLGFYVGTSDPRIAHERGIKGLPLKPGDSILVCSDGLVKASPGGQPYATPEEITRVLATQEGDKAARSLVSFALGRDADDNISVGLIQWPAPRRRGVPRSLLLSLLLLAIAVPVAFLLWRGYRATTAEVQGLQAALVAQVAQTTRDAAATTTALAGQNVANAATATAAMATTAVETAATAAALQEAQQATSTAATAVAATTATRLAFERHCSLAGNYRYVVQGLRLEPENIEYTNGDRFSTSIPISIHWRIANTGNCPLIVDSLVPYPDTGDGEPLAAAFVRDDAPLESLAPGEEAELVAMLGTIATLNDLVFWRDLYRSNSGVVWEMAIAPAGEASSFRPLNQPRLPLYNPQQPRWIVILPPAPTPTPFPTATVGLILTAEPSVIPAATASPPVEVTP